MLQNDAEWRADGLPASHNLADVDGPLRGDPISPVAVQKAALRTDGRQIDDQLRPTPACGAEICRSEMILVPGFGQLARRAGSPSAITSDPRRQRLQNHRATRQVSSLAIWRYGHAEAAVKHTSPTTSTGRCAEHDRSPSTQFAAADRKPAPATTADRHKIGDRDYLSKRRALGISP